MKNYFVYKNGKGNCWADLAHKYGVFYVGFDERWKRNKNQTLPPIKIIDKTISDKDKSIDLTNIRFVSHPANRKHFLLLTFEKTELCFWQVTGRPRIATRRVHLAASKMAASKTKDYLKYFKTIGAKSFRVLPVNLLAKIPRYTLYTSVDSLACYQYLSRGTCRPLWRCKGPGDVMIPQQIKDLRQSAVLRYERYGGEEPFATFVRLYLNETLSRRNVPLAAVDKRLAQCISSELSSIMIGIGTFNPILVETAALMFVYDLGLVPDIGVGKSKDIVDIRARATDKDGKLEKKIALSAMKKLSSIGAIISEEVTTKLISGGTLDIQCKAADRTADNEGVLYFGVKAEQSNGSDVIHLSIFLREATAAEFPNLSRFFAMQAAVIKGYFRPTFK